MLSSIQTKLIALSVALLVAFFLYTYTSGLVNENKLLQASVESYKLEAQRNADTANSNAEKLLRFTERNKEQQLSILKMQQEIADIKKNEHTQDTEIIQYVATLPEGFEKACLNMPVNSILNGMSK